MDYAPIIEKRRARLSELETLIAQPGFFDDPKKAGESTREHARLKRLLETWDQLVRAQADRAANDELRHGEDVELAGMAEAESAELESKVRGFADQLQYALLPPEITDDRDAIIEVRAGTGGDEASLFAADLLRMYARYCESRGWKLEMIDSSPSEVGGCKSITAKISGGEVFRCLRYESGVHRVQRVPSTETQGRIHTSTATVAVLPEAEEVDIQIRPEDVRIDVSRAGGPGGQGVNTTDSAVQITHLPSGLIVRCIEQRSQQKNRERAMQILRAKLFEIKQRQEQEKYAAHRRSLIGSGGREEKIRTYNYPQNRITDHRIELTLYSLDRFMEGDLDQMISALQRRDLEDRVTGLEAA